MITFKNDPVLVIKKFYEFNEHQINRNDPQEKYRLEQKIPLLIDSISNCELLISNILEKDINDIYIDTRDVRICIKNDNKEIIAILEMPSIFKKDFNWENKIDIKVLFIEHPSLHSGEFKNLEKVLLKNKLTNELIESSKINNIKEYLMLCRITDIHSYINVFSPHCLDPKNMYLECYLNFDMTYKIGDIKNIKEFFFNVNKKDLKKCHKIESYEEFIDFIEYEKDMHDYINSYGNVFDISFGECKEILIEQDSILILIKINDNTKSGIESSKLSIFGHSIIDTDYTFKDYIENKNEVYQYLKLLKY